MLADLRPALIITSREVRDQFRDWRVIFPIVGLTVFFPFLMNFTANEILNFVNRYGADIIGERLIPFLMMVVGFFPISVSLVIALDTFVGEKERMSIEPLLNTPLKDWQLYLGKMLASTISPLLTSYLGMTVYILGLMSSRVTLPSFDLIFLIFVLTTVQAVLMVAGAVVVSVQATSVRAANLLASFIIVPMALVIQGEAVVMFWGDYPTLWWAVIGIVLLTVLLARVGLAHFQREELLGRDIDVLNVRWAWRLFKETFTGGAGSLKDWYLKSVPQTVRALKTPILVMTGILLAGVLVGVLFANQFVLPMSATNPEGTAASSETIQNLFPLFSSQNLMWVFWRNMSALLLGALLGTLSIGILGTLPVLGTAAVGGYLFAYLANASQPIVRIFIGFLLPHGVIEIFAAIVSSAAILAAGARLATPQTGKTVGEVFIVGLANWMKVLLGLVIPLLFIAAAIEVWITPRIGLAILGG